MNARIIGISVCALAVIGGGALIVAPKSPPDEVLIESALRDAASSSRSGEPGGVLDKLSGKFKIMGYEPTDGDVADFVKRMKPDFKIGKTKTTIIGNQASVLATVNVKVGIGNAAYNQDVKNVEFRLERSTQMQYLVFPVPKWKIVEISADQAEFGNPFGI